MATKPEIGLVASLGRAVEPLVSSPQPVQAARGCRRRLRWLDAGFVFTIANTNRELAQLPVASLNLLLAVPKGHPLAKLKKLRLQDLSDAAFIWFPRRESAAYYDRLTHECFRVGLKTPHIVQEAVNEATILSLVSCRLGVAFVSGATCWRCPESVVWCR